MKKGIESVALLLICCEGKSQNLTEENYFKQLNTYIKEEKPRFIKFNEITFIKRDISQVCNKAKLTKYLEARGLNKKYSFIAIWKDNDEIFNIQEENNKLISLKNNLFESLKVYLVENKKIKENFEIWLLPKGWNFETFYRKHLSKLMKISDSDLKEKCKEYNHFLEHLFNEEQFRNIFSNLKNANSNISLFDFEV